MTTHRIPAAPYQLSRLRSSERIVLVERVQFEQCDEGGPTPFERIKARADAPYRPGDVLEFYIESQTEGYMAVIRGEETSWTRTVSSVTAKLGRDVATDLVTQWIAEHAESFYADAWYWITEAT